MTDVVIDTYAELGLQRPFEQWRCHAFTDPRRIGGGLRCQKKRIGKHSWVCNSHLGQSPARIGLFQPDNNTMVERDGHYLTLASIQDHLVNVEAEKMKATLLSMRKTLRERPVTEDETHVCGTCGAYNPSGGLQQADQSNHPEDTGWVCVDYEGCLERCDKLPDWAEEDDEVVDEWNNLVGPE